MTTDRDKFDIASATDPGPRETLEDASRALRLSVCEHLHAAMLIVCDGVGGNAFGEVASALAVMAIAPVLAGALAALRPGDSNAGMAPDDLVGLLERALHSANHTVIQHATEHTRLAGMSTTAVAGLLIDGLLHVAWTGDSRCYVHGDAGLRQLTRDHSEVRRLIDAGLISPRDARSHPLAHTINRFIGHPEACQPETCTARIQSGDVVLLCTDGLTDVVCDDEIAECIAACQRGQVPLDELPGRLVRQALHAGTPDNVTVLCCQYLSGLAAQYREPTLTGAYPAALVSALPHLLKEIDHE